MSAPTVPLLAVLLVVYLPQAVVLAVADGREHRLPNRWVLSVSVSVAAALGALALFLPALREDLRVALVLAVLIGLGAITVALLVPAALGMGDAKTLPVVVLMTGALGGEALIAGLLGAMILSGLAGTVAVTVTRRAGTRFPVGPILLATPFLGLVGAPLVHSALGLG